MITTMRFGGAVAGLVCALTLCLAHAACKRPVITGLLALAAVVAFANY